MLVLNIYAVLCFKVLHILKKKKKRFILGIIDEQCLAEVRDEKHRKTDKFASRKTRRKGYRII